MIKLDRQVSELKDKVIQIRRELHKIPEAGMMEVETTDNIIKKLQKLGLEVEPGVSGTGATAFLRVSDQAATIAYRADIDGLSIDEKTGRDFRSCKEGFMHACGHDGHMAILLGFAELMVSKRNELDKNILFIFQPAEEGPGGAEPIVKAGILEKYKVKYIFGLHIYPDIPEGMIGCRKGPMMAQTGEFDIRIIGKSCHGAMPHKGTDAMLAAANMVIALNTVVSRNIEPIEPAVLQTGRLASGERRNVIAGEAILEGTMRAFNSNTYGKLKERLLRITDQVSAAYDCVAEYEIRDMYPAVTNDPDLFDRLQRIIDREDMIYLDPQTTSEDFSYYQRKVPGLFFVLGSRNEELGYVHPLHNNKFDFNEEVLLKGIQVFYELYKDI